MRKTLLIPIIVLLVSCNSAVKEGSNINIDDYKHRISYALGADMGANFSDMPEDMFSMINKDELANGFYEFLTKENLKTNDCFEILEVAFSANNGSIDTSKYGINQVSHCYGSIFGDMLKKSLTSKDAMSEVDVDIIKFGFASSINKSDTLIKESERQKLVIDFNNDLNKRTGEKFMSKKKDEFPDNFHEGSYILIEDEEGNGEPINLTNEYSIVLTFTNTNGDTLYTTYQDLTLPKSENMQVVTADFFPEAWKKAAEEMKVGGKYTIYSSYEMAYGEEGLIAPNSQHYIIQPFSSIIIHSEVLSQGERYAQVKEKSKKILEDAKKSPNTVVDKSGYILTTLEGGKGANVPVGGDVQAHYILTNADGKDLENSHINTAQYGQPAPTFSLNGVIEGWQLAIPKMKEGGRYRLVLPYNLAYGERGSQKIRPYEALTFEIEIVKSGKSGELVKPQPQQMP